MLFRSDGSPEITIGNVIFDADGNMLGRGRLGIGAAPYGGTGAYGNYGALSVPVDLDGDGEEELVTGNAAYNIDGSIKWSNDGLDGLIAVADFDGDGEGEIVKTSGIFVTGMETDGTEEWSVQYGTSSSGTNLGAVAIDDVDADGTPDIVFAAQNELVAMDWGGTEKWTSRISDQSGAAGPVLFDFESSRRYFETGRIALIDNDFGFDAKAIPQFLAIDPSLIDIDEHVDSSFLNPESRYLKKGGGLDSSDASVKGCLFPPAVNRYPIARLDRDGSGRQDIDLYLHLLGISDFENRSSGGQIPSILSENP